MVAVTHDAKPQPRLLLGKRVRAIREAQGISQEAMADIAGVHRTYMGLVERGETNISLDNIVKIARALKVAPASLLDLIK
jgi:transcriptional regulator with XRE-family HTH domain